MIVLLFLALLFQGIPSQPNEGAVTGVFDLNPAKHLADDYLEVLGGNVLTLAGEDVQNFVHDVALGFFDAAQPH